MAALNTALPPEDESCESRPPDAHDMLLVSHSDAEEAAAGSTSSNKSESIEDKGFVRIETYPSPRSVIFNHYDERDPRTQVQEHFAKSLNLPRIYDVPPEQQLKPKTAEPVPMSQRNFPASFWNASPSCSQQTDTMEASPRATPLQPMSTAGQEKQDPKLVRPVSNLQSGTATSMSTTGPVTQAQTHILEPDSAPEPSGFLDNEPRPTSMVEYFPAHKPPRCHAHKPRVPDQPQCEHQQLGLISEGEELLVECFPAAESPRCHAHKPRGTGGGEKSVEEYFPEETLVDVDCSSLERCKSCSGAIIGLKSGPLTAVGPGSYKYCGTCNTNV